MQIKTVGHKVQVTIEGPEEAATLPAMIGRGWPDDTSGKRWEINYPFPEEDFSYYVCIDYRMDDWRFYALSGNGHVPSFSSSRGEGLNAILVGALCRLLTGDSNTILLKMHDASLFAEGV